MSDGFDRYAPKSSQKPTPDPRRDFDRYAWQTRPIMPQGQRSTEPAPPTPAPSTAVSSQPARSRGDNIMDIVRELSQR